jgi:hypothetical protein
MIAADVATVFHSRVVWTDYKAVMMHPEAIAAGLAPGGAYAGSPLAGHVRDVARGGGGAPAAAARMLATYGPAYMSSAFLGAQLDVMLAIDTQLLAELTLVIDVPGAVALIFEVRAHAFSRD